MLLTALSLPDPGPLRKTATSFIPWTFAFLATSFAAMLAAKGVDFLDPLKPTIPGELQHKTFPPVSVTVTMVLLNVAWTYIFPLGTFLVIFLRFLVFVFFCTFYLSSSIFLNMRPDP